MPAISTTLANSWLLTYTPAREYAQGAANPYQIYYGAVPIGYVASHHYIGKPGQAEYITPDAAITPRTQWYEVPNDFNLAMLLLLAMHLGTL